MSPEYTGNLPDIRDIRHPFRHFCGAGRSRTHYFFLRFGLQYSWTLSPSSGLHLVESGSVWLSQSTRFVGRRCNQRSPSSSPIGTDDIDTNAKAAPHRYPKCFASLICARSLPRNPIADYLNVDVLYNDLAAGWDWSFITGTLIIAFYFCLYNYGALLVACFRGSTPSVEDYRWTCLRILGMVRKFQLH